MHRSIGWIGLGAMGLPMATRLVKAGFSLATVVHRNAEPANRLREMGARLLDNPAALAAECDTIVTIVPADRQMEEVLLDPAFLAAVKPGTLLLEMTSGTPRMMKRAAEALESRGCRVLDAPVSGGMAGARDGKLTVMAGGESAAIADAKPVLDILASQVIPVGGIGAGKAVKAINQMLAAVHMVAASEAIALAERLDVDMEALHAVIKASSGGSWIFANKLPLIVERQFSPGFRLDLMIKDIGIALSEGEDVPLALAPAAYKLYQAASLTSGGLDYAVVSDQIRNVRRQPGHLERSNKE